MTAFERDVAGQMIPRDLGGTGNETYNFIPMNCFISGLWQLFVVQPVYSLVNEGKVVKLSIVLTYDNATSTRPSKIASSIDDSKTVKNSSLDNPVPMFVCDQSMIPQSQIVNNKTTITTITTVTISNTTVFVPNPLWGSNVTNKGVDFFKTVSSKDVTKMPQTQGTGSEATNEDKQPQTTPLSTYETTVIKPLRYGLNIGDRHVKAGSNLTLTCNLLNQDTTEPIDVMFKWQKNDMLLAPVEGRIIPQGNQLVIANADEEDSGNYTCLFDYNGREGITDPVVIVVQRTLLHPDCKDHQYLTNCTRIVNARYCSYSYFNMFCCKSCTEAGQLPEHQPGAPPPWPTLQRHNRRPRSFGRTLPSRLTPINAPDHETDFKVRFKSPIVEKFSLH
ncbi:hypothetical protein GE061_005915 [Apolygus lucorum]|uniref:Ig-like domain-containing protein n=1 Tax=Apolygus lucorum TaxID=248454 RepID=A0A8S9WSG8_APOLU|nr:hypothetical protein GE061_005915 [Apolygus lucorum]